ncbi:MAG TPA: hypothetical protein VJ983_08945 [candidate division Zixibacteria bacterium]|nr:hypothetical protein [candidate division Zixibacteria bacterium]
MTTGGWIFMLLSWTVIISVLIFCYKRTFSGDNRSEDTENNQ